MIRNIRLLGVALGVGGQLAYPPALHPALWLVGASLPVSAIVATAEAELIAHERLDVVAALTIGESLLRTVAWQLILSDSGWVAERLRDVGLLSEDGRLLASRTAVIAGITYNFLPFMILPLYVSLEKIDRRLIEAATDLYASRVTAFRRFGSFGSATIETVYSSFSRDSSPEISSRTSASRFGSSCDRKVSASDRSRATSAPTDGSLASARTESPRRTISPKSCCNCRCFRPVEENGPAGEKNSHQLIRTTPSVTPPVLRIAHRRT